MLIVGRLKSGRKFSSELIRLKEKFWGFYSVFCIEEKEERMTGLFSACSALRRFLRS
jgi:hypothetical protein